VSERVALGDLVFDRGLYPRNDISDFNVRRLRLIRDSGRVLDPIVADRNTRVILDGVHRWTEARQRGDTDIATEWRECGSDAERFEVAVRLNTNHGVSLTPHDRLRVIEIGAALGLRDVDLADALAVSTSFLRAIKPRVAIAVVTDADGNLRRDRVNLKGSVRHMSGRDDLTAAQAAEIQHGAPGNSYLMLIRQLTRALDLRLLPSRDTHPVLWADLQALATRIRAATAPLED
jgi:hypothetical protein